MAVTRRWILAGASAVALTGCGGGAVVSDGRGGLDPDLLPQSNPGWDAWVVSFRSRAEARGISRATLDGAFRGAGFLPGVVERDRNQTEFTRTLEDYLAIVASETKVRTGRQQFRAYQSTLQQIEARYGVPAKVTCAIWGMESNYGTRRGDIPVISSTSTLAYEGRRGEFFEAQLMAALRLLQHGDTAPSHLTGSWAGAMGHNQMIPTTYQEYAVDFQGDGRRDIWSDDPTDALASTANYLSRHGWRRGQPWGLEVRLPGGFDTALAGRGTKKSVSEWASMGVSPVRGGSLPDGGAGSVLLPSGPGGPAFLVFRNFDIILRYNNAEKYGLGVGHLADRLEGAGPVQGGFPPDKYGLTIDDRKELQERLTASGFDAGTADGVFGSKTEAAISAYQTRNGLAVTGEPSRELLLRLRRG